MLVKALQSEPVLGQRNELLVGFTDDVAVEATDVLLPYLALRKPPGDIGSSALVAAHAADRITY